MPSPKPDCRSDFSRDAFCWLSKGRSKSFRSPTALELLFSCVAKRKVTKREGHPAWRLPPIHGRQVRESGSGFSSGLLPARKGVAIPGNARCAACRPRLTAAEGPRVEQRAILARTRDGARAKAEAKAKPPISAVLPERRPKAEVEGLPQAPPFDFAAARLRSGRSEFRGRSHVATLSPRQGRGVPSPRHDGAVLSRGPSAAAGGRRISPQGGRQGCRPVWRQSMAKAWMPELRQRRSSCPMDCRQTPQPDRVPCGQDAREARKRGGLSLWLLSLYSGHPALRPSGQLRCSHALPARAWPRKEKVTRAP